jgi:hypothetical protein
MEHLATVSFKYDSLDPVRDIWQAIVELAEAGAWRRVYVNELAAHLPGTGGANLETGYDAVGHEVRLRIVTNPYLAEPVFQIWRDHELTASYVNPATALSDYRSLTTVQAVSFP